MIAKRDYIHTDLALTDGFYESFYSDGVVVHVDVDGVRDDLCHSLRMEAFHANSNKQFILHPTRSAVVVLEWS